VILGTGGSGTRALARLAREAGFNKGANVNSAGDSRQLGHFASRWTSRYLRVSEWIDGMWAESPRAGFRCPRGMRAEFQAAIAEHRAGVEDPDAPWGWKAPRTILILPFVHQTLPSARIVHLVRDGRDMAYSRNQNQLRRHGRHVLPPSDKPIPRAYASMMFWARVNLAAARFGERFIGSRYLLLRYEDLCADPGGVGVRLADALDSPAPRDQVRRAALDILQPSASIGRWRDREQRKVVGLERRGEEALRAFNYL
jgi:hypothetical protein